MTEPFVDGSQGFSTASPSERRGFLRQAITTTGLLTPIALLTACDVVSSAQPTTTDIIPTPTPIPTVPANRAPFIEIMNDENAHVAYLKQLLTKAGVHARPAPVFRDLAQADENAFIHLAQLFESASAGAYLLTQPTLSTKAYLTTFASILAIEARHSCFVNNLLARPLSTDGVFDKAPTQAAIVASIVPFLVTLNGGKDPAARLSSDADILNFLLLLEYLQADFYAVNVPVLFP